ncbi:MAG: hypothetical protein V1776_00055 [Candidatus Diapherotrites archaeon]
MKSFPKKAPAPFPTSVPVSPERNPSSEKDLQELLRPMHEYESKIKGAAGNLLPGTTTLFLLSVKEYSSAPCALLSYFQSKNMPGVYVTINKPYLDLVKTLSTAPDNVKYVDVITALTGRETVDLPHVTFLDSPLALVELNLAIAEKLKLIASNSKFLIIDSVSTLLVYNSTQAVEKFCHTVIAKNRSENLICLLLMVESEEYHAVVETLSQFVDKVESIQ